MEVELGEEDKPVCDPLISEEDDDDNIIVLTAAAAQPAASTARPSERSAVLHPPLPQFGHVQSVQTRSCLTGRSLTCCRGGDAHVPLQMEDIALGQKCGETAPPHVP